MSETSAATMPKTPVSASSLAREANRLPASPPSTMPGAQARTMSQSMPPRRWWAREEEIEVGTIAASEVATATCMHHSRGKPA